MERNTEAKRRLDGRIADLDQRLKGLRALRAAMDDDAIAEEMAAVFASANGRKKPETASQSKNFKTIETFFRSHNNTWATVLEITAGTKLSKNSVRQILYIGNPDAFDREGHRGGASKASSG